MLVNYGNFSLYCKYNYFYCEGSFFVSKNCCQNLLNCSSNYKYWKLKAVNCFWEKAPQ